MLPRQKVGHEVCHHLRKQSENQNDRSREPQQNLAQNSLLSSAFFRVPGLVKAQRNEANGRDY